MENLKSLGLSHYFINADGDVFSNRLGTLRKLKPVLKDTGYFKLTLKCDDGVTREKRIHRLLALAFLPNPENFPCINHKNNIKTDNRLENLEWCTVAHNNKEMYRTGIKKCWFTNSNKIYPNSKIDSSKAAKIKKLLTKYTIKEVSEKTGASMNIVMDISSGRSWKNA